MITTDAAVRQSGRLVSGDPARFLAQLQSPLPEGVVATLHLTAVSTSSGDSPVVLAVPMVADGLLLSVTLTAEQVAVVVGDATGGWAMYRITAGTGSQLVALFAGILQLASRWDGVPQGALLAGVSEAQAARVSASAAEAARVAAAGSADDAAGSAGAAAGSAQAAAGSASAAATAATAAAQAAAGSAAAVQAAQDAATSANGSAGTATTKAGEASISAAAALASQNAAAATLAAAIPKTLIDAKGDLLVGSTNGTIARLAVGTNGTSLLADSAAASGLAWTATPPAVGLYLPGLSTDYVSTPHAAGAQIGDDLDIRVDLIFAAWTTDLGVMGKGTSTVTANATSWTMVPASANRLSLRVSDGTNFAVGTHTITGLSTGVRWRLRMRYVRDTGSGQYSFTSYSSQTFTEPLATATTWTTITTTTGASIGATLDYAAPVLVGAFRTTSGGLPGTYLGGAALVGGVVKVSWDGRTPHTRQRDSVGNILTVNGTASAWQVL